MADALPTFDVAVVGGGPAGLVAALVLARSGADVALVAPPHRPLGQDRIDTRTAALFAGSIVLLQNLGIWETCAHHCAKIDGIRIIDDTGQLLRAPEMLFGASEVGRCEFGFNVPNAALVDCLNDAVNGFGPGLKVFATKGATAVELGEKTATVTLAEGTQLQCKLVAAADGRNSLCRKAAGIGWKISEYDQSAVACLFAHELPHEGISSEFHRPNGPLTTVPMPTGRLAFQFAEPDPNDPNKAVDDRGLYHQSSLVWVEQRAVADDLAGLSDQAFSRLLSRRLNGLLGAVTHAGPRAQFPLSIQTAEVAGARRVALIGEAGHVIPPIGAQGLNLSLRDVAVLAECVTDALKSSSDPGGDTILAAYADARAGDVSQRTFAVDMLNRSLTTHFLPVQLARGFGLHALNALGGLRRRVIEEGLQPSGRVPPLMRPGQRVEEDRVSTT